VYAMSSDKYAQSSVLRSGSAVALGARGDTSPLPIGVAEGSLGPVARALGNPAKTVVCMVEELAGLCHSNAMKVDHVREKRVIIPHLRQRQRQTP
jgi:hypothetical protein